jgi:hypothetical protein
MKLFTQGWYDRVEALLARAVLGASFGINTASALGKFGSLLLNRVEAVGAGAVAGQAVALLAPSISMTPPVPGIFGPSGSFLVSAMLNVVSSNAGDEVQFQLARNGVVIPAAPAPTSTTDAVNRLATCTIVWSDEGAGPGPFIYSIVATNLTGVHTVNTNGAAASSILVQEEL